MAAPAAAAAPPSRAATAQVVDRGTVVAKAAAVAARGQERPISDHATLGRPGTSSPADGRSIGVATSRVRIADPGLVSVSSFAGIGLVADELALEPPDPWIAASSSHLVQSTNHMVRMTDRTGKLLVSLPTWALFALDPSELDADPRILWDAAHGRWVGVLMSFQPDLSLNFLNLAISEGSDPTGAWDVFGFAYFDGSGIADPPRLPGDRLVKRQDRHHGQRIRDRRAGRHHGLQRRQRPRRPLVRHPGRAAGRDHAMDPRGPRPVLDPTEHHRRRQRCRPPRGDGRGRRGHVLAPDGHGPGGGVQQLDRQCRGAGLLRRQCATTAG